MVSGADNPTLGAVFQGVGSRLRRAFSGDYSREPTLNQPVSPRYEPISQSELSKVIFIAAGAERKATTATDYRNSADRISADLLSAKEQLEDALERYHPRYEASIIQKKEHSLAIQTLARINMHLGYEEQAESLYALNLSSHLFEPETYSEHTALVLASNLDQIEIGMLRSYVRFLAKTGRNLQLAARLGRILLWGSGQKTESQSEEEDCNTLLALVQIHNQLGEFDQSLLLLEQISSLSPSLLSQTHVSVCISQHRAVTLTGFGETAEPRKEFVVALTKCAVVFGMWHPRTLEVLYQYGAASRQSWDNQKSASILLGECCLGRSHRFGPSHPLSKQAFAELEKCSGPERRLGAIHCLNDISVGSESALSVAYEHVYLRTVIDLVASCGAPLELVKASILNLLEKHQPLGVETTEHRAIIRLRVHRALAVCVHEQGDTDQAIQLMEELNESVKRSTEGTFQSQLDLATFLAAKESTRNKATRLSCEIFFEVDSRLNSDQAAAFHRSLSRLNLAHFPYDPDSPDRLPIKTKETVGTGAYAVVESVEIGGRLYARKSIALPRYNQNRIRQTIHNEIAVIRSLSHPHIVKVYCTYEERSRFAIILQPLATFDLEALLDMRHDCSREEDDDFSNLIWKWFRCLANALAFMHSKGIRHKDIKTRNILVKDSDVVFADFGSSHAFLDEGSSVTEGPAFGHTLAYCAPEVITWEKRSRSADIFSLGCVYTEMATTLDRRPVSAYFEHRQTKTQNGLGETHAYHATLDLVDDWFKRASVDVQVLYKDVISPMLSKLPSSRPAAPALVDTIQRCFKRLTHNDMTPCGKCDSVVTQTEIDLTQSIEIG